MSSQIIRGNALNLPLADDSVDLVVTSPPYFGLRSYQDGGEHYDGQIGDEATPAEFVDALIAATREMVRVVKPSGSIWVNLGDKYSGAQAQNFGGASRAGTSSKVWQQTNPKNTGIPNKSLIGIPWRYAIRCIDDLGLILRAEVIWSKPNGLPESVTDRVRRSHETWFHFTLNPRYYSAVDEVREEHGAHPRVSGKGQGQRIGMASMSGQTLDDAQQQHPLGKLPSSVWDIGLGNPLVRDILDAVAAGALTPDEGERLWTSASDSWGTLTPPASAGNGSAGRTHAATERPRPTSSHDQRTGRTESPTDSSSAPSLKDSPSTTPAATSRASDPSTSNPSPAPRTSAEHGPSGQSAPRGTASTTPTPSAPDTGRSPSAAALATSDESTHGGSVWRIATEPLRVPEHLGIDHFAAFPTEFPRRIITGWSPRGVCVECGAGRRPVVGRGAADYGQQYPNFREAARLIDKHGFDRDELRALGTSGWAKWKANGAKGKAPDLAPLCMRIEALLGGYAECAIGVASGTQVLTGYACDCPEPTAPTTPGVVLDPFGGTGTTALVADALGRHGISVDMSRDYCRLATWRTTDPKQRAKAARKPFEPPREQVDGQLAIFEEMGA